MEISQDILGKVQPLNQSSFTNIKDSEFRPSYDKMGLKQLRDKARNERDLRELYRGRAPYELLQNANDSGASKAAYILTKEGLAFIHDGAWFSLDNFISLADGWSDKDPNACIGHKGLGFRSVLDITPSPYLIKVDEKDFFAIKFTWALNKGHFDKTFQKDKSLRVECEKWKRHGQIVCPVMAIPGLAKKHNLGEGAKVLNDIFRGAFNGSYTTMFWFPAVDPDIETRNLKALSPVPIIANQIGNDQLLGFLNDEVRVLLPFLSTIRNVSLYYERHLVGSVEIPQRTKKNMREGEITVSAIINDEPHPETYYYVSFEIPIPHHIKQNPETPKAVRYLKKASIALLIKIKNEEPLGDDESKFHVYFPTEEKTGTGFIIHGDFYVKPDRSSLMQGDYNEWLLSESANRAANAFLSKLINKYDAKAVFKALAPNANLSSKSSIIFIEKFSEALKRRKKAFIPTGQGFLKPEEVAIPPKIDSAGFWEKNFSDVIQDVFDSEISFLDPAIDSEKTRKFLKLVGVEAFKVERILDFIEIAATKNKNSKWWYDCYSFLANDETLSVKDHSHFTSLKLIPTKTGVIAIPEDDKLVICMPPLGKDNQPSQPTCFERIFQFIDNDIAQRLNDGPDTIKSWVLSRFRIAKFEASDLIPKTIRAITPMLYSGDVKMTVSELYDAWIFIKDTIIASRQILSETFWQDVSRFTLPIKHSNNTEIISPDKLAPAILVYWPDAFITDKKCLLDISGLRRVDTEFLNGLIKKSGDSASIWISFFEKAGVSSSPKQLKYRRIATKKDQYFIHPNRQIEERDTYFTGEYQSDINKAVVVALRNEAVWHEFINNAELCDHELPLTLQSVTIIEGLALCVQMAEKEYNAKNENWTLRLASLIDSLPINHISDNQDDTLYCRGGTSGGHPIEIGSYVKRQLNSYRWLPSTNGPANSADCFLRQSSRRIISKGRAEEELGDILIPYVVVEDIERLAQLQRFGIEVADDINSCSIITLLKVLNILAERLGTDWGKSEIINVPRRWRLIRGAIQEIYRSLNLNQEVVDFPEKIKLATRSRGGIEFCSLPISFAEPGSAIEKAFKNKLCLIDTDRVYSKFFKMANIQRLDTGKTVQEQFMSEERSKPGRFLLDEIVNKLSIYLLSPVIAKSEKAKQGELIVKRIKERFSVRAASSLIVSFSLIEKPEIRDHIEFPLFYLQRKLKKEEGAGGKYYYTLFFKGTADQKVDSLDADVLGEVIAPVFLNGITDEQRGLFPRITSRYQQTKGDPNRMRQYLFRQLGISIEAQEVAQALITGEDFVVSEELLSPPPPVRVVQAVPRENKNGTDFIQEKIEIHKKKLHERTNDFVGTISVRVADKRKANKDKKLPSADNGSVKQEKITAEQQDRGLKGEEEIKRRIELPGGWEGFVFSEDKRYDGCGYDFLCQLGEKEVKMEVKTFSRNGRIFFTPLELQKASEYGQDYYLIGLLDNGPAAIEWQSFSLNDPINTLLEFGEFDFQTKLQASPSDLFNISQSG